MKIIINKVIPALLAIVLLSCGALNVCAVSNEALFEKHNSTGKYLKTLQPQIGSIGGEWLVIGLSRADSFSESQKEAYYRNVVDYVKGIGSNKLHKSKSTENSRVIIALSSIGKDARDVSGYDLTEPLEDFNYIKKQGINGSVWALTALNTFRYKSSVREKLIGEILGKQLDDGGWNLGVGNADADITAMAVQALAPFYNFDENVKASINKALKYLQSLKYDRISSETCAQIIVAVTAIKNDPADLPAFDRMMSFSVENGFEHESGNGYNQMATEQCFYALTAYRRFIDCNTPLYDMTDKNNLLISERADINDITGLQRYLADFDTASASVKLMFDINCDGIININDVTALQRSLAGYPI